MLLPLERDEIGFGCILNSRLSAAPFCKKTSCRPYWGLFRNTIRLANLISAIRLALSIRNMHAT
jgi:hypothetical protein